MRLVAIGARFLATVLAATLLSTLPAHAVSPDRLEPYAYESTRSLVALVEDAADLMAAKGQTAFAAFSAPGSRWFEGERYLFVYAPDGTCVFHAATPELVGRNLMALRDMHGKPMIQMITDIAKQPGKDASGWVFYLWTTDQQLLPQWKSAYIRKVVTPDGKTYLLGSGSGEIRIEKAFVKTRIKEASDLLATKGKDAALRQIADPASDFNFLDSFIFVMDERGHALFDPGFPNLTGRDWSQFRDLVGVYVIQELLRRLKDSDRAWVQYLWQKPGEAIPVRKLIYARKIVVGGETLVVGSDFPLATPIWMKVEAGKPWRNPPT